MAEIKTKKNSPDSIDISRTKIILEQMMNSICKIKINESFGTGFFCEVPPTYDEKILKVLMTNCHILDPIDYCRNKEINLVLKLKVLWNFIFLKLKRLYYIQVYFSRENIAKHENVISLCKLSVHLEDPTCLNDYVLS